MEFKEHEFKYNKEKEKREVELKAMREYKLV